MSKTVEYENEFGDTIKVEEMSRVEAIEQVIYWMEVIETSDYSTDCYIYVEYNDGSYYINFDGDISGKFKKTGIKNIIMDDGYEYYIYGPYIINENDIPETA